MKSRFDHTRIKNNNSKNYTENSNEWIYKFDITLPSSTGSSGGNGDSHQNLSYSFNGDNKSANITPAASPASVLTLIGISLKALELPIDKAHNTINLFQKSNVGIHNTSIELGFPKSNLTRINSIIKNTSSSLEGVKWLGRSFVIGGATIDGFEFVHALNNEDYGNAALSISNLGVGLATAYIGGAEGFTLYFGYKTTVWFIQSVNSPEGQASSQRYLNSGLFHPGSNCFITGTLIYGKFGLIPIENIQIGDSVWTYNLENDIIELNKVGKIFNNKVQEIYEINSDNQKIFVTAQHPFYVESKGWVKVKDLHIGDKLKTNNICKEYVKNILKLQRNETVYNIEVEGNHNYYVTNSYVLVHNK